MGSILLGDVLEHAVALYGDRTAVIDGAARFTYRELSERVRRLAGALLGLGISPGSHIGILANNSHRYLETYFAAHYAGTPLAPLNTRLAAKELEFILRDGEIHALIVGPEFVELLESFRDRLPELKYVIVLSDDPAHGTPYERLLEGTAPLAEAARAWREDDMLYLCYTGGTTGLPKGVMLSQRNVLSNAEHALMSMALREGDVYLHVAPMFHLADAWACFTLTMIGATHVFLAGFAPEPFMETVQRERISVTILVPTMINFIVNHPSAAKYDYSSLRLLLFGASPMPVDRILAARKLFGPILCQAYGMTETAPLLVCQRLEWLDSETERLSSCGREVIGVRIRCVDDSGHEVAPGEVGEIVASGPNIMLGYWKREEETRAALREGWMYTGDVGYIDEEGFVFIVDRAKDMIISGGENIYSSEVEDALYKHAAVLEAAVIGIPNERWGEVVHGVVVLREGADVDTETLIAHCHEHIAGYKCPKSISFQDEPLPKSGPGKILKNELRAPFWAGQERQVS